MKTFKMNATVEDLITLGADDFVKKHLEQTKETALKKFTAVIYFLADEDILNPDLTEAVMQHRNLSIRNSQEYTSWDDQPETTTDTGGLN